MSPLFPSFCESTGCHLNTLGKGHLGTGKKSARNLRIGLGPQPWHWWDLFLHYEEAASARWRQSELGWWHGWWGGFSIVFSGKVIKGKKTKGPLSFLKKTRLGCFLGDASLIFFWGGWISLKHFHPRIKNSLFFSFMWNCRIIRRFIPPKKNWEMMFSSEYSTMLFLIERLFCSAVSQASKLMKQTNKQIMLVRRFNRISWTIGLYATSTSQKLNKKNVNTFETQSRR